jgi:uncharacterized membrane protein
VVIYAKNVPNAVYALRRGGIKMKLKVMKTVFIVFIILEVCKRDS